MSAMMSNSTMTSFIARPSEAPLYGAASGCAAGARLDAGRGALAIADEH